MPDGRSQRKKLIETVVSVEPGTLGFHKRRYLRNLEVRNYSRDTIRARESHLRYFILWCDERGIMRPEDVSVALLARYQRHMYYYRTTSGRPLSSQSQGHRLREIRAFYRSLVRTRVIEMSLAESLELPRNEYRLPKTILSVDEGKRSSRLASALLEVLYATGIRRFEVCNLKIWDIDLDNGTMMVRQGKGKKDRCIPIGERACLWLQKYLDEVRPLFAMEPDNGFLFLTKYREAFSSERVSEILREVVTGRSRLVRMVVDQANSRSTNLPSGYRQGLILDVRGQTVSSRLLNAMVNRIARKTGGAIRPENIHFVGGE